MAVRGTPYPIFSGEFQLSEYKSLIAGLDDDKWHRCRILSDWCADNNKRWLSLAWKWIADNKRWPYKHRERNLYGWYTVPGIQWGEYRAKRESAIPNILTGGDRVFGRRGVKQGRVYMKNVYVESVSKAMDVLASGLAVAIATGDIK